MILGYNTQTQSNDEYNVIPSVYLLISLEPTLNQSPLLKKKVYVDVCMCIVMYEYTSMYW